MDRSDNSDVSTPDREAEGYILDSPYVAIFNSDCTPVQIATSAQAAGVTAPSVDVSFRFADFGCGRGITLLLLAAAYPDCVFFGLDLNPEHIAEARSRAKQAGLSNLEFICGAFGSVPAEVIRDVDFAVAHGVYSWVSEAVRAALLSQLRYSVKPDGLALLSYYTAAGYAQTLPLRNLLSRLAEAEPGDPVHRRRKALDLVRQLERNDVPFFQQNPVARSIVQQWDEAQPGYLEHEYFAENFRLAMPMDVAEFMSRAGFTFCGDTAHTTQLPASDVARAHPSVLDEVATLSDAVPFRKDVFAHAPANAGNPGLQIADADMFGAIWPRQIMERMESWNDEFNDLAVFCIERPRTWKSIRDHFQSLGEEPRQTAARLRCAMSARVLTRYHGTVASAALVDGCLFRFKSELSGKLIDDPSLRNMPPHLPSRALGGAVPIPPEYLQIIAAGCEVASASDWAQRATQRVLERQKSADLGVSEEAVQRKIFDQIDTVSRVWVPFLVAAGVLEKR